MHVDAQEVDVCPAGHQVRIRVTHLHAGERIGRIPEDTADTPLVSYQTGWLLEPSTPGATSRIRTETGRTVEGELIDTAPEFTHSFGLRGDALQTVRRHIQEWKSQI